MLGDNGIEARRSQHGKFSGSQKRHHIFCKTDMECAGRAKRRRRFGRNALLRLGALPRPTLRLAIIALSQGGVPPLPRLWRDRRAHACHRTPKARPVRPASFGHGAIPKALRRREKTKEPWRGLNAPRIADSKLLVGGISVSIICCSGSPGNATLTEQVVEWNSNFTTQHWSNRS